MLCPQHVFLTLKSNFLGLTFKNSFLPKRPVWLNSCLIDRFSNLTFTFASRLITDTLSALHAHLGEQPGLQLCYKALYLLKSYIIFIFLVWLRKILLISCIMDYKIKSDNQYAQ